MHFSQGRDTVLKTILHEHLPLQKSRIIQIRQVEEALVAREFYVIKHRAHAVRQVVQRKTLSLAPIFRRARVPSQAQSLTNLIPPHLLKRQLDASEQTRRPFNYLIPVFTVFIREI